MKELNKKLTKTGKNTIEGMNNTQLTILLKPIFDYWYYKSKLAEPFLKIGTRKQKKELKVLRTEYSTGIKSFKNIHSIVNEKLKWKADKFLKGGDIISPPERVWKNGGDDCDSLPSVIHYITGNTILLNNKRYRFQHYNVLLGQESHVISVWGSVLSESMLILSNLEYEEMTPEYFYNEYIKQFWKIDVKLDKNLKFISASKFINKK